MQRPIRRDLHLHLQLVLVDGVRGRDLMHRGRDLHHEVLVFEVRGGVRGAHVRELARDDDGREVRSGERADGRGERAVLAVLDPGGDEGGDGGEGAEVDVRSKGWEGEGGTGLVYFGQSVKTLIAGIESLTRHVKFIYSPLVQLEGPRKSLVEA